jgi:hypothetical protein
MLNMRASASSSSSGEVQSSCKRPAKFQRSSLRLRNKYSRTKATDIPDKSTDVYSDEHNEVLDAIALIFNISTYKSLAVV